MPGGPDLPLPCVEAQESVDVPALGETLPVESLN